MKEELEQLLENAYSPYYNFPVAAIITTRDGKKFSGVNVENSNGTSVCAERNAIHNAIANGYKRGDFDKLYIMSKKSDDIVPCFACRQVMLEFLDSDTSIICMRKNGTFKEYKLDELCPYGFKGENLK